MGLPLLFTDYDQKPPTQVIGPVGGLASAEAFPVIPPLEVPAASTGQSALTRRIREEGYILTWGAAGGFLGALYAGKLGGVVGFALAGWYATRKFVRD